MLDQCIVAYHCAKKKLSLTAPTTSFNVKKKRNSQCVVCVVNRYFSLFLGPFSLNGTPLRRVAQAYVIATKTKVDISTIKVPNNLSDEFFRRSKPEKKKGDSDIFSDSKKVWY